MKYISLLCLLVVLALPVTVEAHTHLESSAPESGGALSSENPGVTLTFDSKVQEPTALTVTGENGEELQIDNYTHSPDNVIAFNIPEEAAGGDIEVFYSIIGEDGHVMENQLTFQYTVNDKASEPEASETEEPEAASGEGENAEGEESEDQQVEASEQGNESMVWIVPVLGFGLLITAVLVFLGIRKKS